MKTMWQKAWRPPLDRTLLQESKELSQLGQNRKPDGGNQAGEVGGEGGRSEGLEAEAVRSYQGKVTGKTRGGGGGDMFALLSPTTHS